MRRLSARHIAVFLAVLIIAGLSLVEAGAQARKRRSRSRRAASSAVPRPTPLPAQEGSDPADPQIVSTADQTTGTSSKGSAGRARNSPSPSPTPDPERERLRQTITDLSGQVNKMADKLSQMEEQQRALVDIERLSRAEQRAETFRSQLRDVQQRQTDIQLQVDQVEFALQPEQIERMVAAYGTMHPEVAREQRRKQLEAQRTKLKAQNDQLEQSRVRLESAIVTADLEVDRLQRQIDLQNQQASQDSLPTPTPLPVETPAPTPDIPPRK
jgi:hypothetical protein